MEPNEIEQETSKFRDDLARIRNEVAKTIVGQEEVVEAVLTAILAGGNVLLEGVPGLGKTVLVKALSEALHLEFRRIQFTPDLMPADILGTNVLNQEANGGYSMEFRKGPIFTQLLLADEINRATPKTQSALLETMQEATVTVAGNTYELDPPFFVLATQNPIEQEGTYPLPEAQLDRFMFKVQVPFVSRDEMNAILSRTMLSVGETPGKVIDGSRILEMRNVLNKVVVADEMRDYATRMVLATHPESEFAPERIKRYAKWGASPRAAQALIAASRVRALSEGREHISFADLRHFAAPVLQHRILVNYDGQAEQISPVDLIAEIVDHVPETAE